MTGENVGDIGVGVGVGQRAQQELCGVSDLEGAGGGAGRPTRLNSCGTAAAERCTNRCPTETASSGATGNGPGDVAVGADMLTARIQAGPTHYRVGRRGRQGAGVSTVVSKRLGLCGDTCL
jgi:hypothetical protein